MESVIESEKKQTLEELEREKVAKENAMRKNMYAKYVKEINLPKIAEGSPIIVSKDPLPNRFTHRNHQRNKSMHVKDDSGTAGLLSESQLEVDKSTARKKLLIWELEAKKKRQSVQELPP